MAVEDKSGGNAATTPKNDYVLTGPDGKIENPAGEPKKDEAAKVVEADTDEDADEDENEEQSAEDTGAPKKRKRGGFQKKIERLEAEIAELKNGKSGKEAEGEKPPGDPSKKADDAQELKRPQPEDFETYDDYVEALTEYKTDLKLNERDKKNSNEAKEKQYRDDMQSKADRYEAGKVEARKDNPDFDDVLDAYDGPLTINMQVALLESEMGAEVAYYLAKPENREKAEAISKMGLMQMNKENGRIEVRLEKSKSTGDDTPEVRTTKAPPPITPVGKGKGNSTKDPGEMSYEEYKVARAKRVN